MSLLPCAARFVTSVQISVYRSKKELSLRASAHTGVAIPQSFRDPYIGRKSEIIRNSVGLRQNTALRRRRGSPHQSEDWFAMTSYFLCAVTDQQHDKRQFTIGGALPLLIIFYSFTPSTMPLARPTKPCISLGMMILVALPSAMCCIASMLFSLIT